VSLARTRLGTPRSGGERQALSVLLAARGSAVRAATEAQQQVFSLVIAAPEPIRARFRGQKLPGMLATAARPARSPLLGCETTTTVLALRSLARRFRALNQEAAEHQKAILAIIRSWRTRPARVSSASARSWPATVLCAWSHPGRIHSEAAFAMLAGVAPIPANSGQVTNRYRLNRHGDRQLNRALHNHRPVPNPLPRTHPRLRRPPHHRGQTSREIKRCLSRYIARDPLPPPRKRPPRP